MDEEIVIGRTHSVEPRTVIGIDYPIVCYQPGIERGKEYVLAIEGLGQTQTTTLKFPH